MFIQSFELTHSAGLISPLPPTPDRSAHSDMSSEKDHISPENSARQKKGKALLHVPSRSSSQRQQYSPTASSGISGATATDSRQSLGDLSKDSIPSMHSRQRNGSASSHRSGAETDPATTPMPSQPVSPATPPHKKKKSGGFLSLLGCCGSPRETTADGSEENVHKLDRLPNQRPATSKSKAHTPTEQQIANSAKAQLDEKEAVPQKEGSPKGKRLSNNSTHAQQATSGERPDRESKQSTAPAPSVHVQPPNSGASSEPQADQHVVAEKSEDDEGDVKMGEVGGSRDQSEPVEQQEKQQEDDLGQQQEANHDETSQQEGSQVPPPPGPSGNAPAPPAPDTTLIAAPETPQKSLLPPILPEHMGRKCLVLDLDETLVHSSFKVCAPRPSES